MLPGSVFFYNLVLAIAAFLRQMSSPYLPSVLDEKAAPAYPVSLLKVHRHSRNWINTFGTGSMTGVRAHLCTCQEFGLERIKERVQEMRKGERLCGKKDQPGCSALPA